MTITEEIIDIMTKISQENTENKEKSHQIDFKEIYILDIEKIYEKYEKAYLDYQDNFKWSIKGRFYLEKAWDALKMMLAVIPSSDKIKFELEVKNIECLLDFGSEFQFMGNLNSAEEYFEKALAKINEVYLNTEKNAIKYQKLPAMQADAFRRLGILYENMGNITKAEGLLLKSYKLY